MNIMRKRISIGRVALTSLTGAVKCGGAAVNEAKTNPAANTPNTRARTTRREMKMVPTKKQKPPKS